MNEVDNFLSEVIPQLRQEIAALHNGTAEPRKALWSHRDPVTLFGAELSGHGWSEIEPVFDRLAASFSGSQSCDYEVVGAASAAILVILPRSSVPSQPARAGNRSIMRCASPLSSAGRAARGRSRTGTATLLMTPLGISWLRGGRSRRCSAK